MKNEEIMLLLFKCYKRSDYKGNGTRGKDVK